MNASGIASVAWSDTHTHSACSSRSICVRVESRIYPGKLNPRLVGTISHTFHISNLKKCHVDEPLVIPLDGLHIDNKLHFIEENIEIMDREVKRLKPSYIPNCQSSLELSARS
ncbi:hypothetical protein Tco_0212040 [Tanacetum coccineum]